MSIQYHEYYFAPKRWNYQTVSIPEGLNIDSKNQPFSYPKPLEPLKMLDVSHQECLTSPCFSFVSSQEPEVDGMAEPSGTLPTESSSMEPSIDPSIRNLARKKNRRGLWMGRPESPMTS